jgi:GNAT superfamily N-acetyltransferase
MMVAELALGQDDEAAPTGGRRCSHGSPSLVNVHLGAHQSVGRGEPSAVTHPRFRLLGIGAAASPRFPPAGLLIEHTGARVALDGGPGAEADGRLDARLVTDGRAELMPAIRRAARDRGLEPAVRAFEAPHLGVEPLPVVHTSHPTFGYLIGKTVVWAPEFWR